MDDGSTNWCVANGCIEPADASGLCERHRRAWASGEAVELGGALPPGSPLRPPGSLDKDNPASRWRSKGRPAWNRRGPRPEENATMGDAKNWGEPVDCPTCGRQFKSRQALGCHLSKGKCGAKAEAPGEPAPPADEDTHSEIWKCELCGREFWSLEGRTAHIARAHGGEALLPSSRQALPAPAAAAEGGRPDAATGARPMALAVAAAVKAFGVECEMLDFDGEIVLRRRGTRDGIRLRDDGAVERVCIQLLAV